MAILKPQTPLTPEQQLQRRRNLGVGLAALSETLRGGDPVARTLGLQQQFEQQEAQRLAEEQRLAKEQRLQQFAQTNPQLARMYELFGEQGLQQGYLRDIERQQQFIQSQQEVERLKNAGFSNQEINLILSGVTPKDILEFRQEGFEEEQQKETLQKAGFTEPEIDLIKAGVTPKDVLGFREIDTGVSGTEIIENVEKNVAQTIEQTDILNTFVNLDQAFGPVDALQEGLSKATRVLGFDVDPKTGAAVRGRNSLNTEILANLAADFTGRPNMLIYENLKGNLPMSAATSHADAREKYENIRDQVDARIKNLEEGLISPILDDKTKNAYRDELYKSKLLSKKLDAAILSLKGKKEETLIPEQFTNQGRYSKLYKDG